MTIFLASREAVAIKVPLSIKSRKMTKSSFRLLYLQSRTLLKFGQNVKKKKTKDLVGRIICLKTLARLIKWSLRAAGKFLSTLMKPLVRVSVQCFVGELI